VRQPLNNASAALQSAEAVLRGHDGPEASSRLVRAQRVVGQVMARIDNTLAAAELVAGGRPIVRQDTDIDTLIALAVADMPASDRARVLVERATHTRTASMDLNLMRLALRNVLSNALDHTPDGRPVTVRVSDSDDPLALLIDVIDQGPGVGTDVLPQLFQRGARGSSVPGRPSLGLGLYIVRRVMELHGGQVELADNSPQGATLRLWLTQMEGV
jgi:signal transduction histidine kinase